MKKTISLLFVLLLPGVLLAQAVRTRPVVFNHVTVIDVRSGRLTADMAVVVAGGRITATARAGKVRIPKNAQMVDAGGKFLIPGLWDMHVHALTDNRYEWFFPLLIANGVTGVRELGNNLPWERIDRLRREIAEGKLLGPRFGAATARILDGADTRLNVATPVAASPEARRIVRDYKQQGVDFIKPYNLLSREVYLAIADEARRQKIPLAGHVPFSMSAAEVSDIGQITIEHNADIFLSCSRDEEKLRQQLQELVKTMPVGARQQIETKAAATYDERRAKTLFDRFVRNGTWICPTILVNSVPESETAPESDPRLKYVPSATAERWRSDLRQRAAIVPSAAERKMRRQRRLEIIGLMERTGVRLLAGSDAPNPFVFPGFGLHDELALLVRSGLSPLEALQAAIINPVKFLGMEKSLGTIEKGKLADLVLLDANPLENIENTRTINAVVSNGKFMGRATLDKMLAEVETAVKQNKIAR